MLRDAEITEFHLRIPGGTRLFVRRYQAAGCGRRTLVIVHGASEHGGRYAHVARAAVARGWNVVIPDLRGHGRSDGIPVHVGHFDRYVQDLNRLFDDCRLEPAHTALLGHSMGGLLAIRCAQDWADRVAALVAASPLLKLKVPIPRWKWLLGRALSVIAPRFRFASLVDPAGLTRDAASLARRFADPLMHTSVTAGWFFAVQGALPVVLNDSSITLPTLLLHGDMDPVTDPSASREWFESISSADKTCHFLPDHLHELLNEPDWQETLETILDWLEQRIPG